MKEIKYSTSVYELLKRKPPFLIRNGYVFLVLFMTSFYIISNHIKIPYYLSLTYKKADSLTYTLVFKDLNTESLDKGETPLYIAYGNRKFKVKQLIRSENELFISISYEDYSVLHFDAVNNTFYLVYFISLTNYIHNFLFNI